MLFEEKRGAPLLKTREGMQKFHWGGKVGGLEVYSYMRAFIFFIIKNQGHMQRKKKFTWFSSARMMN